MEGGGVNAEEGEGGRTTLSSIHHPQPYPWSDPGTDPGCGQVVDSTVGVGEAAVLLFHWFLKVKAKLEATDNPSPFVPPRAGSGARSPYE
ncbi:hypothetical protein TNIN_119091 [Trichonephila inaurata madagascariensis]|uniref:Uncharacterized protein n=1 Tax=Trichonephila inaurata madagascariensis TaxID=2747483 RepID=A0A8X6YWL5_9ARAC|nr:hypothetical protein TNIN_119091 [Trichonephila inaurata madagascariensis]